MDYKKLIEDSKKGLIDWNVTTLVVDNDTSYFSVDTGDEDLDEGLEDELKSRYGKVDGHRDIVDVLNAVGINAELC